MQVFTHHLDFNNSVPNNPQLPLLIYQQAMVLHGSDPAALFEQKFDEHGWPSAWRNGILPFHHYHSNAHEALGVYSGEVTVQFGGTHGPVVDAAAGDLIILPAGVGHKCLETRGGLGIVGAYPTGQVPDLHKAGTNLAKAHVAAVAKVGVPEQDPVFGADGPLHQHWTR